MSEYDCSKRKAGSVELTHHDFMNMSQCARMAFIRSALWALKTRHEDEKSGVHGNITPKNLCLNEGGICLLDNATKEDENAYKPIEYFREQNQQITQQSDIYALGAVFYQLIAGTVPPKADQRCLAKNDFYHPLSSYKALEENFPSQLLTSVDKALSLEAEGRWNSADAWRKELTISENDELRGINELLRLQLSRVKQSSGMWRKYVELPLMILGALALIVILVAASVWYSSLSRGCC